MATEESGCSWLGHDASWGRGWGFLASWGPCVVWKGFPAFPAHLRMRPVSRGNSRRATWVAGERSVGQELGGVGSFLVRSLRFSRVQLCVTP